MSGQSKQLVQLASLPRGRDENEELRVSLDEFTPDNGKPSKYVSLRLWYKGKGNQGDWLPTKKGLTVRIKELDAVLSALEKARAALQGKSTDTDNGGPQLSDAQERELF